MNIESLEINLLKASEIKDGDVVLVKIKESQKSNLNKDFIKKLYQEITNILKKEVPIYFFPDNLSFEIIKKQVNINSTYQENIESQENENIN